MVSKLIEWIFHMELHEMSDNDHRILQSSGALNKSQFAPIYALVGAVVFGLMLICCRRICRKVCPTGELLMHTLDVEDIQIDLEDEDDAHDAQALLRDPEAASKLMTRPGMIAGAGKRAPKNLLARQQRQEDQFELERYLDHANPSQNPHGHTPSRHMSPVKYTPAKSQTPERNVDDEDKEDDDTKQNDAEDGGDDDMWKLWNKTYDSKHNVAVKNPSQEIKPAAKPAYQSIKFKKNDGSNAHAPAARIVPPSETTTSPLNKSPSRHNLPRLDLSPIHEAQMRRSHHQLIPKIKPQHNLTHSNAPTASANTSSNNDNANRAATMVVPLRPLHQDHPGHFQNPHQKQQQQQQYGQSHPNANILLSQRAPLTGRESLGSGSHKQAPSSATAAKPPPPSRPPPGYYQNSHPTRSNPMPASLPRPGRGPGSPPPRSAAVNINKNNNNNNTSNGPDPPRHRQPPDPHPSSSPPRPTATQTSSSSSSRPPLRREQMEDEDDDLSVITSVRPFDPNELI